MQTHCFVLKPRVVLRARMVAASPTYPANGVAIGSVSIGSGAACLPGMMLRLGTQAGWDDLGRVRVKRQGGPTFITTGRYSQGTRDGELWQTDGAWVDVLDLRGVWAKVPRIDITETDITGNYVMYKDGDIPAGGLGPPYQLEGGAINPPPVANAGPARAATIDPSTGRITVNLSGAGSFRFNPATSLEISLPNSYQWNIADGTLVSGTLTSQSLVVTFPAGFRYISLTVGDSVHNTTHTMWMPIFARDPANDLCFPHRVESLRATPQGQELTVRIMQDLPRVDYPDGTLVMLFDDDPAAAEGKNVLFCGWTWRDDSSERGERTAVLGEASLTCVDTGGKLRLLPGFSQVVEKALTTPQNWMQTQYPNFLYYTWYLLHWHSTALDVSGLLMISQTPAMYQFNLLSSEAGNLYDQVSTIINNMAPDHYLNCTRRNQLCLVADPLIQNYDDRPEFEADQIEDGNWTEVSVTYERHPRFYQLLTYAIDTNDADFAAIACRAPGDAEGQGAQILETSERYAQGQFFLNVTEGNRYARMNSPYTSVNITMPLSFLSRNYEPAFFEWVRVSFGDHNPRDGLESMRGIITQIQYRYTYDPGGNLGMASISWEAETWGPQAVTFPLIPDPEP